MKVSLVVSLTLYLTWLFKDRWFTDAPFRLVSSKPHPGVVKTPCVMKFGLGTSATQTPRSRPTTLID